MSAAASVRLESASSRIFVLDVRDPEIRGIDGSVHQTVTDCWFIDDGDGRVGASEGGAK